MILLLPRSPFFPTRRSSDLPEADAGLMAIDAQGKIAWGNSARVKRRADLFTYDSSHGAHQLALMMNSRSEEHTSELQSRGHLVCRLLLEKKKCSHSRHAGRS